MKTIIKKSLVYIGCLVAVLAWMIFSGHKESLSAKEVASIQEFDRIVAANAKAPVAVASEAPVAHSVQTGIIADNQVRLRVGPGTDQTVALLLNQGDQVELVEKTADGWWKVRYNGGYYFVHGDWVTPQNITGQNN